MFLISIKLHFKYSPNNIYQNIANEEINLICLEECHNYLLEPFIIKNNEEKQNNFYI